MGALYSAVNCSAAEDIFGPFVAAQQCNDGFDFTLTFEQYLFSTLPAAVLLLVAPFRIHHLCRLPTVVRKSSAGHIKLVSESTSINMKKRGMGQ